MLSNGHWSVSVMYALEVYNDLFNLSFTWPYNNQLASHLAAIKTDERFVTSLRREKSQTIC